MTRLLTRILPIVTAALFLGLLEAVLRWPRQFIWALPAGPLGVALCVWVLTGRQWGKIKFWNFLLSPGLLSLAGASAILFPDSIYQQQVIALLTSFFLLIFLELVYTYFLDRPVYQPHALENVSSYVNVVTIFLLSSSLANVLLFFSQPLWLLGVCASGMLLVAGLLCYQLFWASELPAALTWRHVLAASVILAQTFVTMTFLPSSVYVNAGVMTISYYILSGLSRNWLLGIWERRVIVRYLVVGLSGLGIILLTAKWL